MEWELGGGGEALCFFFLEIHRRRLGHGRTTGGRLEPRHVGTGCKQYPKRSQRAEPRLGHGRTTGRRLEP